MKHLKSRHQDLREIFEHSIVARHIAEFNLQVCRPEEEAEIITERMREKDFDVLPMEEDGRIVGTGGIVQKVPPDDSAKN